MAVLVLSGGGTSQELPTDYEQIINYTMLYDAGDECEEVTGGWGISGYSRSDAYVVKAGTKNKNNIFLHGNLGADSSSYVMLGTLKSISLKDYSFVGAVAMPTSIYTSNNTNYCINLSVLSGKVVQSGVTLGNVAFNENVNVNVLKTINMTEVEKDAYIVLNVQLNKACKGYFYNVFITKSDDITTLCNKAGVGETDLDSLLADTSALTAIFNNEDAVNFMVKQCTGDFMVGVLNSAEAVALLKASPYLNTIIGNPHWAKFIMMIPVAKELLNVTMLYDEGDECSDVTGGLTVYTRTENPQFATFRTSNTLSFDEYSKIAVLGYGTGTYQRVDITFEQTTSPPSFTNRNLLQGENKQLHLIDNTLSGNYYIFVGSMSASAATFTPTTTKNADHLYCKTTLSTGTTYDAYVYGLFLLKSDNWAIWASLGGVTATDLDTLLADTEALATLMSNENAVKYLCGCTGDLMIGILNSATAVEAITNSAVATLYLTEHPVWKKFIDMIPTSVDAGLNLV